MCLLKSDDTKLHFLHLFDLSPLWILMCFLKFPSSADANCKVTLAALVFTFLRCVLLNVFPNHMPKWMHNYIYCICLTFRHCGFSYVMTCLWKWKHVQLSGSCSYFNTSEVSNKMAAVSENDSSLADKCLAFCQAMNSQGKAFKFSLSISNTFSFSLDSRGGAEPLPNSGRKRASPSTLKRNARRRSEFLGKKNATAPVSEENQVDLETSQQALETDTFKCDQCATAFKTRNGLKIHTGKSHKQAPNSPEKLRETSSQSLLAVSPTRENSRTELCPNCGEDMSPTHLCQDDDLAVEPEVGGEDKQEDIDKGEIICNCTNSLCCACHHKKSCRCANYHPERSTWHCTCTYFKARPGGPRPNMVPTCGSLKHPE